MENETVDETAQGRGGVRIRGRYRRLFENLRKRAVERLVSRPSKE